MQRYFRSQLDDDFEIFLFVNYTYSHHENGNGNGITSTPTMEMEMGSQSQITNGKRSIVKMLPGSVFLCPGPVPGLLGWAYPEQLGLSSTACGLVLANFIRPCTNGVSLLHRIASVAPLSKPQTMF